jgi:hypothetical protein
MSHTHNPTNLYTEPAMLPEI